MDVSDLQLFEAVSRHGSMNRAAAELNTVQSNVTTRIRALEDALGLPLFARHARGVSPTPAGHRLLPFVPRLTALLEEAASAARGDGAPAGPLVLGALETTTALRLSPLLSRFALAHPAVRLAVTTGTTQSLVQSVLDCRLEGAFVGGPIAHPSLASQVVFREELVLVAPAALADPAALAAQPGLRSIVFRSGCSYRQRLEAHLAERGIVTAWPMELGSLDAILACVAAGAGITLLPRAVAVAAPQAAALSLHALPPDRAAVETLFIQRKDAHASTALRAFLALAISASPAGTCSATAATPSPTDRSSARSSDNPTAPWTPRESSPAPGTSP